MHYIADLHIHSPYSRATSKSSHLHGLAAWATIKGIDVVGTGDFTHPGWLSHLKEHLKEAEPGFFRLRDTDPKLFNDIIPPGLEPDVSRIRFVLTSEISSIYKRGGKVRKIHNILFAPDLDSVRRVNASLSAIGNLESDGRPILGLDSHDLLEILLENAPEGFLVPAHIWTPWFSLFGSKSGFNSIEECFGDLTSHIFALETGLSSDPDMNRTISALDAYSLISNSDCHSPGKLGREANMFNTGLDFFSMREAIRHPVDESGEQLFTATIEFYPEEGKYHCDGHRKCKVCMEPRQTREHKGICPKCGKPLTVGVLYRVMELADRREPVHPKGSPVVHSLIPLQEILGELLQVGPSSKKVMGVYVKLVQQFGSEFSILLKTDISELEYGSSGHLAEAIDRMRSGRVIRKPGYDGEFGNIQVFSEKERKSFGGQLNMFSSIETETPKKTRRHIQKLSADLPENEKKKRSVNKELNPEQLEVVESEGYHILVKAGPGTGKTHTLVQRVVRVVSGQDVPCTVITFTNKAAKEIEKRLAAIFGKKNNVYVATLHGYCLKWLREIEPGLKVAGPDMRRWFLRELCEHEEEKSVPELEKEITAFLQQAPDLRKPIPKHLQPYFSMLEKERLIDIDAVIPTLAAILSNKTMSAENIRQRTGKLFIDEFQDLNQSQYQLVRLLSETSPVFAIGDPDQAIYGFRGSSPKWFFRFIQDLQPQQYVLHRNYRSGGSIVEAAANLISNNPHIGPAVQNISEAGEEGDIYLARFPATVKEADFIVQQIEQLIGGSSHREIDRIGTEKDLRNVALNDIAVLYRTTRQAESIARALFVHGIPFQVVDIRPYYLYDPVRPIYFWILLATGHADITHLLRLLESEPGIGKKQLREIERNLPAATDNILEAVAEIKDRFSAKLSGKIEKAIVLCKELQDLSHKEGVGAALARLISLNGLDKDEPDLARFLRLADNFDISLDGFAQHLLLHNDSVVYDERAEAITLMTLHAAKGLEFKVVFMVGLEEGTLPVGFRGDDELSEEKHIEEERRLFYVGMTRAEETLFLSHVEKKRKGGKDVPLEKSRFLHEIPPEFLGTVAALDKKKKVRKKVQQLRLFDEI